MGVASTILCVILFLTTLIASGYNYTVNVGGYGVQIYPYQQYAFPTVMMGILAFFVGDVGLH